MNVVFDVLTALLTAAGALAIGWVLFGRLVAPVGAECFGNVFAVVCAEGSGADLQHAIDGLLWLNRNGLSAFRIVIADAGLNEEGRRVAASLAARQTQVSVCPLDQLDNRITANLE